MQVLNLPKLTMVISLKWEVDLMKLTEIKRRKLNRICQKYNDWHYPAELQKMWDEIMAEGIIVPAWAAFSGHCHPVETVEGEEIENSLFYFSEYKVECSDRVEYTIYFS